MDKVAGETLHGGVSNYIRSKIYDKELSPSDRIPSEHELMREFSVSRGTVRKAIKTLVDEGLVVQEHGRGTFVSKPHVTSPDQGKPFSFAASLHDRGIAFTTKVLIHETIPANADVASHLRMTEGEPVLRLRRVRHAGAKPIMVIDSWTPLGLCPGIERVDFKCVSIFDAIERTARQAIAYSSMAYSARAAGKEIAELMQMPQNTPILNLEQLMLLEDGRPVEWGDTMLGAGQTIVGMARKTADTKLTLDGNHNFL